MLKLNNIGVPKGATRDKKRRGRGPGSGTGKTGGRGHKGQRARSGGGMPPWFEGGQMPLNRRLPKRGFTNIFKKEFQLVNLDQLEVRFEAGAQVDASALAGVGLIKHVGRPVKLLGRGTVAKSLQVVVNHASKTAVAAIEAAGGSVTIGGRLMDPVPAAPGTPQTAAAAEPVAEPVAPEDTPAEASADAAVDAPEDAPEDASEDAPEDAPEDDAPEDAPTNE